MVALACNKTSKNTCISCVFGETTFSTMTFGETTDGQTTFNEMSRTQHPKPSLQFFTLMKKDYIFIMNNSKKIFHPIFRLPLKPNTTNLHLHPNQLLFVSTNTTPGQINQQCSAYFWENMACTVRNRVISIPARTSTTNRTTNDVFIHHQRRRRRRLHREKHNLHARDNSTPPP